MLNKLIKQPNLAPELARRINDCDELVLMRALKRISNTEIAAILSTLSMEQVNQILIILPPDIANRVVACGFNGKKASAETLRKLFDAIDIESKHTSVKRVHETRSEVPAPSRKETPEVQIPAGATADLVAEQRPFDDFSDDRISAASLFLLDTIGKIVGNSFRKH